ncbi:MAG: carboxypeptidase regulatory-like domain-containing protein [Ignavibacteriales bacterium]|nr:carboxypeptidase regulatory-like domain-containing protein [Ignavibacteriales bacterium]MCF8307343.1 carboxypeptidase regulatory-like domain-containing protein [Ignavibacteriales bacterium]MCF8316494.1 carboxypeptidase regulatory-like domain-containing protein [Ignavibacteriales bacterium]MCF8437417.1 carboxypeptidase regulatory-like domain-containing protein [Ignavibacteriales bacterium]
MKQLGFTTFFAVLLMAFVLKAQPQAPIDLTATEYASFHHTYVKLVWDDTSNVRVKYNVYKKDGAASDSGEYNKIASRIRTKSFSDMHAPAGNTYSYYVTASDLSGESEASNIAEITVNGPVPPAQGVISGYVTNSADNQPVPFAEVKFIRSFGEHHNFTRADSNGYFSKTLETGDYYMFFSARDYYFEYYDNVRHFNEAAAVTVNEDDLLIFNIGLDPIVPPVTFTLSGNVNAGENLPLGASVSVYKVFTNSMHHFVKKARTDSLGNYSVQLIEGDTVVVYAKPLNRDYLPEFYNDKSSFAEADRIFIGGDVTGIDLTLDPKPVYANSISGAVTDSAGTGILSYVKAIKMRTSHHRNFVYTTQSDSMGVYSIENLEPGNYVLFAKPSGDYRPTYFRYDGAQAYHWYEADTVVATETSILTDYDFTVVPRLNPGECLITGRVTGTDGQPVEGAYVFALNDNSESGSFGITDKNGRYVISGLTPATYNVFAEKESFVSGTVSAAALDYNENLSAEIALTLNGESTTGIHDGSLVSSFELNQNYPNPFNPSTTISFSVPASGMVKLSVFDILGREVSVLVNQNMQAGIHTVNFNASDLSSGLYIYRLQSSNNTLTKKMMLIK